MSELIGSLKTRRPEDRVTLACRSEFAAIAGLFPIPPDDVIGLDLNPYLVNVPSENLRLALSHIVQRFHGFRANILIDGSLRPPWLTYFLAAQLEPGLSLTCAVEHEPGLILPIALGWFCLPRQELVNLGPPPEIPERDRYRLLLNYLATPRVSLFPWPVLAQPETGADEWLASNGLAAGSYVACFPGGDANVPIKRWPQANFIRVIDSIRRQGFRVLLLGNSAEQKELAGLAQSLEGESAPVFCGNATSLPLAVAILSKAAAYFGNDTGPMHVAQAYGIPGVAIFGGGGQWPRYAPWAAGSVGMVHPLPCFGCDWDCFLGRGLCVDSIPAEAVSAALLAVLSGSPQEPIQSLQTVDPGMFPIIADASARYRSVQRDRAERLRIIAELSHANERLKASESRLRYFGASTM
jgi:Glycosyltransferase family 9 (heptosyltransferase)